MAHEQSETIQNSDGRWINIYGRGTPRAGQRLPGDREYSTMEEAVDAARERSRRYMPLRTAPRRRRYRP